MDKTRFTRDPHLDSEGFVLADAKCNEWCNPVGWQEADGVPLPRITWADRDVSRPRPDLQHYYRP